MTVARAAAAEAIGTALLLAIVVGSGIMGERLAQGNAAVALLGVKTFSEAVEINATLARRGVDAMIEGSAKLSEIGVKAMSDASRPVLSRLGESWSGLVPG